MDWSIFGRWEWLLIELFVLALAILELVSVRRSLRRDREAKSLRDSEAASTSTREAA